MRSFSALPEMIEQACTVLVRKPALEFSRTLRSHMDKEPEYIQHHESEVLPQIRRLLFDAGVTFGEIDDRADMVHVAREVVVRLRGIERGTV